MLKNKMRLLELEEKLYELNGGRCVSSLFASSLHYFIIYPPREDSFFLIPSFLHTLFLSAVIVAHLCLVYPILCLPSTHIFSSRNNPIYGD